MDVPNNLNPFTTTISTSFTRSNWIIDAINNPFKFRGIYFSILTFTSHLDDFLVLDGHVVVTFYLPPTVQTNSLTTLPPP